LGDSSHLGLLLLLLLLKDLESILWILTYQFGSKLSSLCGIGNLWSSLNWSMGLRGS
jgi:hypothetical protein